ncbi:TIGR02147 family protein [Bacteriovorax sp. BAL6_X]|uniref:TIGR02147 family protein n=1 Tax=Bacteriovorax sp. BAL6_X TaxID=1201290 RepID=UPI000385B49A|nr:TIGR02147 family protein [Bacteriovorax sp. BAL6_X]EPZ49254.1 TIGR02147 family protein [Bacteriovorax sp. BAL6_X]
MDYLDLLTNILEKKKAKNKRFSMRSFANYLDMDPGLLSKYLNGKREIPDAFIESRAQLLGITDEELSKIKKEVRSKEVIKSFRLKNPKEEYTRVDMIHQEVIKNWQYYAILELMKVKGFDPTAKWIAEELHTTEDYAQSLIDDLVEAKLLEIREDGDWLDLTEGSSTHALSDEDINMANKESQRRILDLAKLAIDEVTPEFREQSSMMMATNKKKIVEAKVLIRDFRRKLCDFLEDTNEYDSIYQLSLSLFPLSGKKKK